MEGVKNSMWNNTTDLIYNTCILIRTRGLKKLNNTTLFLNINKITTFQWERPLSWAWPAQLLHVLAIACTYMFGGYLVCDLAFR